MTKELNTNRVPRDHWSQWSETARRVFNHTYTHMMENQWVFMHPKQEAPPAQHWRTQCWNCAWIAADAADDIHLVVEE